MESIGARLKKARESKGISIEKASTDTKIQKKILIALEEDNAAEFLNSFYIKNFLKSYALYLGLDSASVIKEYSDRGLTPQSMPVMQAKKEAPYFPYKKGFNFLIAAAAVIAFIVLCSFALKAGCMKKGKTVKSKPKAAPRPIKKKEMPVSRSTDKISIPKDTPLKLSVTAKKNTWMMIKLDGKTIFQNVLTAGQTEEWVANEAIQMWVGDAGGVYLVLNGYKIGSPGKQGEVIKEVVFTRQGMKIGSR